MKLKIELSNAGRSGGVFIDGTQVPNVRAVEFKAEVGELPVAVLTLVNPAVEILADMEARIVSVTAHGLRCLHCGELGANCKGSSGTLSDDEARDRWEAVFGPRPERECERDPVTQTLHFLPCTCQECVSRCRVCGAEANSIRGGRIVLVAHGRCSSCQG